MKLIALLMAMLVAITPTVAVIDVVGDEVFVDINGEVFSFYGEGFAVGEHIKIVFANGEVKEVLPW